MAAHSFQWELLTGSIHQEKFILFPNICVFLWLSPAERNNVLRQLLVDFKYVGPKGWNCFSPQYHSVMYVWWVEPYTNIWINFTLLSLLWHILGKSHDTPGGNNGAFNLPPKLSLLLMRGAAILDFAVGVGEVLLTFWVGNPTSGGHSSWNFQLGARKWLPSSNGTHHYLNCSNTHSLFIFSFQCLWGEHQSNKKEQVNCRHYLSRNLFIFTSDELLLPLVVL